MTHALVVLGLWAGLGGAVALAAGAVRARAASPRNA
jgi:hypothetical protein